MAETPSFPTPTSTSLLADIPPSNLEAEQAVLGALLIDQDAIIKIADILSPDDFYADKHRLVYESMMEIYSKREPIDVVSLSSRLDDKNVLKEIGGRSFLVSLTSSVPTASNVTYYAQIVHEKATLRRLIKTGHDIVKLGHEESGEVDQLLDRAEQTLFAVSQQSLRQNFVPLHSILTEAFDRLDEIHKTAGKLRGVSTGYFALDNILGGL